MNRVVQHGTGHQLSTCSRIEVHREHADGISEA
jgi:hypothetical protein